MTTKNGVSHTGTGQFTSYNNSKVKKLFNSQSVLNNNINKGGLQSQDMLFNSNKNS